MGVLLVMAMLMAEPWEAGVAFHLRRETMKDAASQFQTPFGAPRARVRFR